ncbi:hypothetical protein V6N13_142305 [Hibiscus sabdariffa]|uniref:GDPGP1-like C-terminal domain-containing protein n=1 Tax=Hibiscus sabdariffa TaxID=183260 RepID=A0ABR2FDT1_9ROSI
MSRSFATINHLHFQAYYLAMPFPIEKAPTKKLTTLTSGVVVSELLKYPVRGLIFEGGNTLKDLSDIVSGACICLQENNIAYNILISDCGKRIFLLPQCYAEKQALGEVSLELLDTQVNPAVWEISGHMVLKRRKGYDEASEEDAWRLLAAEKQALGEVSLELLDTQVNPAVWEISGHMVLKRRKDYDEASEEDAWRLLAAEKQALGEVSLELLDTQVNPAVWEISGHMVLKRRKDYDEASEEDAWRLLAAEKQALGEVSLELLDTQVNPAVWEISGHMVLKRRKDYDEASEEDAWRLLAAVSLSDERFHEVNELIFEAIAGSKDVIENSLEEPSLEEDDAVTESSHYCMVAGTQECLVLQ